MKLKDVWTLMLDKYESGNSKVVESTSFMLQFKNGRFVTWDDLDDDGLRFELSGFRLREDRRLDFVSLEELARVPDILANQYRKAGLPKQEVNLVVDYKTPKGSVIRVTFSWNVDC